MGERIIGKRRSARGRNKELDGLKRAARLADSAGLVVAAGHGLDYRNVGPVARIPEVKELNIGFSIIAHAVEVGLFKAVREMRALIRGRRG